jgi:hypothetical protein
LNAQEKRTDCRQNLSQWRFILGLLLFVFGFAVPLFIPLVVASELPTGWKTILSGFLGLGAPEFFMLLAAVVLGKAGFNYLKTRSYSLFKRYALPKSVGRTRHHIGIALFLLTVIVGWLSPYLSQFIPVFQRNQMLIGVVGDLIFLISLFVLGGDFWDKLKALFIFESKANIVGAGRGETT